MSMVRYLNEALEEMMPELLEGTNLRYEKAYKATSSYDGRDYMCLFAEGKNPEGGKFSEEYGVYIKADDGNSAYSPFKIRAGVSRITTRSISYINGGSSRFGDFRDLVHYEAEMLFDKEKFIDIGDVDSGKYDKSSGWGHRVDYKAFLEDHPDTIAFGYGYWHAIPAEYADEMLRPVLEDIKNILKGAIPEVAAALSKETVMDHLDEFRATKRAELAKLAEKFPKCYCSVGDSTPEFRELSDTMSHDGAWCVEYGTLMGFRKHLVWNNELYLWLGNDEKCSLWC